MANEVLMHLQHSESVVSQMAATILAGLMQSNAAGSSSEDELVERSAILAIKLAMRVEKLVKSDEEWLKKDTSSGLHR